MEEAKNEKTPSASEAPETASVSKIENQHVSRECSFDFQMLLQHMGRMEGINMTNKVNNMDKNPTEADRDEENSNGQEQDEEIVEEEKSYIERCRDIRIDQATKQVKKSDMSTTSLTFEEYMTSFDKPLAKPDENPENSENRPTEEMTKNIGLGNITSEEHQEVGNMNKSSKDKKLKDIMKENYVIHAESDSDDSDSSDDGQNTSVVSEKGDGHVVYHLRKPEEIKKALKESLVKSDQVKAEEEQDNKYIEEIDASSDKNDNDYEEINTVHSADVTENQEIPNYIPDIIKSNTICECSNEVCNLTQEIASDSDSEKNGDSSNNEEGPYYKKLDRSEATKLKPIEVNVEEESAVKSKEEIKEELIGGCQTKGEEDPDPSYREILKWKLKVPDQNVQVLLPIQRKQSEQDFKDELEEMLEQTKPEEKPEFEITPPKEIAEENDKILYPRNTKESICCTKYTSMFTESGKKAEVKPPLVHKVLKLSQNYPVFRKTQNEIVKNEVKEEEEESEEPENSLVMCNKISEVRHQMAEFNKNLEEFNERSRLAREEVIKDYNSAVEKELKIVEKLMKMREHMFDKKYTKPTMEAMRRRKPGYIDDNVLKKHFEDMDMILEEDSDSDEEAELKATMEEIKKKYFKDMGVGTMQCTSDGEYVLSKVPKDANEVEAPDEEEKKDEAEKEVEEEKKDESKDTSEGIVFIDSESYEEYLTTNEEEEEDDDEVKEKSEKSIDKDKDNYTKESNESCEEYFTTNEEDSEEYFETSSFKQENRSDLSPESPKNYHQFINKLRKEAENDDDEDDEDINDIQFDKEVTDNLSDDANVDDDEKEIEASSDDENLDDTDKEVEASQYNEKENDDKAIEPYIIKRTINCSLEMQLAKKTEGEET